MGHRYQSPNKYSAIGRSSAMILGSRAELAIRQDLEELRSPLTNTAPLWWVGSKKSPARITQRGSRADLEACTSRPKVFSHKRKLLDVIAITFWRWTHS